MSGTSSKKQQTRGGYLIWHNSWCGNSSSRIPESLAGRCRLLQRSFSKGSLDDLKPDEPSSHDVEGSLETMVLYCSKTSRLL